MNINHITGGRAKELQVFQPINGGGGLFVDPDVLVCRTAVIWGGPGDM